MGIGTRIVLLSLMGATLAIILFSSVFENNITGKAVEDYYHTYTKAICNESNFCQDYEIICYGEEIKNITQITGAAVQHSADWKDPRDEETINKLC